MTQPTFDTAMRPRLRAAAALPDRTVWPWDERDRKRAPECIHARSA